MVSHFDSHNKKHKHSQDETLVEKIWPKIFVFGGLNENNVTTNDLYLISITKRVKSRCIETIGKKPSPWIGHALVYIKSINSLLIYGGKSNNSLGLNKI